MTKKSNLLILIFVAVGAFFLYSYNQTRSQQVESKMSDMDSNDDSMSGDSKLDKNLPKAELPPVTDGSSAGFLPTQMESPEKFEALQKYVKDMGSCLDMKVKPLDPQAEFNFDSLYAAIGGDLGSVVFTQTEWKATDLKTSTGEIRRLYLENNSESDDGERKLKYFSMAPDGMQKEIPLSADQSVNPSDTLLASLESDGTVIGNSESRRVVFENGSRLSIVEKDGKIYSFQLPHNGKVFQCSGIDNVQTMQCICR